MSELRRAACRQFGKLNGSGVVEDMTDGIWIW